MVGIGNPLAGDDGAGVEVVSRLESRFAAVDGVLFTVLDGDLWALDDLLDTTERLIVVDAVIGDPPGTIVTLLDAPPTHAASLHQTDVGTVLATLAAARGAAGFPEVEIHGITIATPRELGVGLSPAVAEAVEELVLELSAELASALAGPRAEG